MINLDFFRVIEKAGSAGASPSGVAKATGHDLRHVRNWCSKWARKKYLTRLSHHKSVRLERRPRGRPVGTEGRYVCGPKEWAELTSKDYLSEGGGSG